MSLRYGKILGTVTIAILFCSLAFGQNNRPANVPIEQLPSRDIRHHITFTPQETFQAFSDSNNRLIGPWVNGPCLAVDVSGNITYFGNGGYLEVVDISDQANPNELGKVLTPSVVKGVTVNGSYADAVDGIYIIQNDLLLSVDEESIRLPGNFLLAQSSPNSFNPVTTISCGLPKSTFVNLSIYSITGQLVETIVNDYNNRGLYTTEWNARDVGSGIYFYKITAGALTSVHKCLVEKRDFDG